MELISSYSVSFNCVTNSSLNNPSPPSSHPLLTVTTFICWVGEKKNMELISSCSFSFNCVTYSSLNNNRPPSSHPLLHLCGANASSFAPNSDTQLSCLKNNLPK